MRRFTHIFVALAVIAIMSVQVVQLFAQPTFADDAFARVWNRQDRAVFENRDLNRSWTWGPENISGLVREDYAESIEQDGKRTVQYFDKSRMEINDPTANPNNRFYVTNGLLPIEMMTGRVQTGDSRFEQVGAARITAVGDPGNFPTYADLLQLYQPPIGVNPADLNRPVTRVLNPDGSVSNDFDDFIDDSGTILRQGDNNHGVAQAFLDFQNVRGLVYENNQYVNGEVFDPLFVFGLPITEPYWVRATVGGEEVPVLFQVFERRVLTYNPANPPNFRVEMGNVGQHYYEWRYGTNTTTETSSPDDGSSDDGGYPTP